MEKLTELKRKYLLDSADLIKRIADSMLRNIHNTVSVTELDCYIKQAISIYVMAIGHTPYYNTDLIPDFDDYTLSFNSIVSEICNSDFHEYTNYIFSLADALYRVLSAICNSDYFKYVKTCVPIVLDDDLDIDPFYDELLPLPLEWIKMKPEERVLTFIYRGNEFSIKDDYEFGLAYDMIISGNPKISFPDFFRSDYSNFLDRIGYTALPLIPFSEKSYEYYLKKCRGIKHPTDEMNRYSRLYHSFKNAPIDYVLKVKKKALNCTQYRCIL